tara:strand:- start:182 stop:490 length:309 start_codon:yes stop_codon:yes gene_type:complete
MSMKTDIQTDNQTGIAAQKPEGASAAGSRKCWQRYRTGKISCDPFVADETAERPAAFCGWTKMQHCAHGDGSNIGWMLMAVLEMPTGEIKYEEPHKIRFENK